MSKKVLKSKLRIMVASTVYGFKDQIEQICSVLQGYGYEVWNSHIKTIPVHPGFSNTENCLKAVQSCDLLFGIINPRYGAVPDGDLSITHQEMKTAIQLRKPRWFIVHHDISVARQLLKQYMYNNDGSNNHSFSYKRTNAMEDIRLIDLYNDTILDDVNPAERIGHWVDEYFRLGDILRCLDTQFKDINRVDAIVREMNK